MTDLVRAAQWYRANGFRVLPLDGKFPHPDLLPKRWNDQKGKETPTWLPLIDRSLTDDEIGLWFGKHRANIGIATGHSGYIVVDCDTREEAVWWYRNRPATSLMVKTRNGVHFYYRATSEQVGNRQKLYGRSIDIRGFGGYVVAAPSVHPDGGNYERKGSWCFRDVPEFDSSWLPRPEHHSVSSRSIDPANSHERNIQNAMDYIGHIHAVEGQGGSSATCRAAGVLQNFGLNRGEALEMLKEWNKSNAIPPWTDSELARKVQWAFSR